MSTNNVNPLLMSKARIPGETFALPSGGLFYNNGELGQDIRDGEVHVYPMTAYDEILIKTPDLLFNGKAVEEIFSRCIPGVIKPMELIAKDVDFLLIALRLVSFGPQVNVLHKHDCEKPHEHKYEVSIQDFIHRVKRIDANIIGQEYTTKMSNGMVVGLSPMRYGTVVAMMTDVDNERPLSPEEMHKRNSGHMASLISSVTVPGVEGQPNQVVVEPSFIEEWVKSLTILDMKALQDALDNQRDWGADTHFDVVCKDCDTKVSVNVPLNPIHFFTWS